MKTECMYCKKVITNPFVEFGEKGRIYAFCNRKHRDKYCEKMIDRSLMLNPFMFSWAFVKEMISWFKRK